MYKKEVEKNNYLAMLSESCNRLEDMLFYIENLVKNKNEDLNIDERNLVSSGFFFMTNTQISNLRRVQVYELKENKKENSLYLPYIREYKNKIKEELNVTCYRNIFLIDNYLLKYASDAEAQLFYLNIKANSYIKIADYSEGAKKIELVNIIIAVYEEALKCSKSIPNFVLPVLSLMLNYTIFLFENVHDTEKAISIAQETVHNATLNLSHDIDEDLRRDSMSIINLIKENVSEWKNTWNEV